MRNLGHRLRSEAELDEHLQEFKRLGSWTTAGSFEEFRSCISWSSPPHTLNGLSIRLVEFATEFHMRAGTLTPSVLANLQQVELGRPLAIASHQPNFATYLKQFALFPPLAEAAKRTGHASVFLALDYDTMKNDRFVRAQIPDLRKSSGWGYVSLPVSRRSSSMIALAVDPPTCEWVTQIVQLLRDAFVAESRILARHSLRRDGIEVGVLLEDIEYAGRAAESMADFAMILLSRLVNLRANLDTVFVSGAEIWQLAGGPVAVALLENWKSVLAAQETVADRLADSGLDHFSWWWLRATTLVPLWWACVCGSRVRLDFVRGFEMATGCCDACKVSVTVERSQVAELVALGRLIPRVSLLNFAKNMCARLGYGFSYMSSGSHAFVYGLVGLRLGIRMLPQVFLDVQGSFGTPVETLEQSGCETNIPPGLKGASELVTRARASSVYYLAGVAPHRFTDGIATTVLDKGFDSEIRLQPSAHEGAHVRCLSTLSEGGE